MSEEIKFDHFKDINELLQHIDLWCKEDDIEYTRWFGLTDLYNLKIYIVSLQQKVEQLEKKNKILKENAEHNDKVVDKVNWENMLLKRKNKEIDRLNNIINELEKWLDKKEKLTFNSWNKGIHEVQRKLQELKENKK